MGRVSLQKATTAELKKTNTMNVLEFIYGHKKTSKLEIASGLDLSRPTVSQIVQGSDGSGPDRPEGQL